MLKLIILYIIIYFIFFNVDILLVLSFIFKVNLLSCFRYKYFECISMR